MGLYYSVLLGGSAKLLNYLIIGRYRFPKIRKKKRIEVDYTYLSLFILFKKKNHNGYVHYRRLGNFHPHLIRNPNILPITSDVFIRVDDGTSINFLLKKCILFF